MKKIIAPILLSLIISPVFAANHAVEAKAHGAKGRVHKWVVVSSDHHAVINNDTGVDQTYTYEFKVCVGRMCAIDTQPIVVTANTVKVLDKHLERGMMPMEAGIFKVEAYTAIYGEHGISQTNYDLIYINR